MKPGEQAGLPVARYLRPEEAVVPFRARPELDELLRWCVSGGHAAVRLITGNGGAGKTRLALRLGEELTANGWQPLWVPRGSERDAVEAVHTMGQPCVLVVDYAETRGDLASMLDGVAADEDGPDLRAVLLARSAGEWWQQLLDSAEERTTALLEAHAPVTLGPLRAVGGLQEVFDEAIAAFAQEMGVGRPDATLALSDPDPVVLVVHAAALLAVVDCAKDHRILPGLDHWNSPPLSGAASLIRRSAKPGEDSPMLTVTKPISRRSPPAHALSGRRRGSKRIVQAGMVDLGDRPAP